MIDWSTISTKALEFVTNWWNGMSSELKWTLIGFLVISIIVIWIFVKIIGFITKVIITGLVIGGIIFLLIDQTGNISLWVSLFPLWEGYQIWEKGIIIFFIGIVLVSTTWAIVKISKETLFSPRLRNKMNPKKCAERGGIYDPKFKTCSFK